MKSSQRYIVGFLMGLTSLLSGSSRTVLSESTREPVVYASVGVINRNLGTVTDPLGIFSLHIPSEYVNDT